MAAATTASESCRIHFFSRLDLRFGVPCGSQTLVAAVKEKGPVVIQGNLAAWIALYRTLRTQGNAYWTFIGPLLAVVERR